MMKSTICLATIFVLLICSTNFGQAQQDTLVIPVPTKVTFLNDIINGDTTSTGARKDTNRVYVLSRGGTWFVDNPIVNAGYVLNIQASKGSGEKPNVYALQDPNTSQMPEVLIDMADNLNVKDIVFCGFNALDTASYTAGQITQIIIDSRIVPGLSATITGCVFSTYYTAIITGQAINNFKLYDNIFCQGENMPYRGTYGGRPFDNQGFGADSVIMMNNTFVDFCDLIFRRRSSTAPIVYFNFSHNTVVNHWGYYGTIHFSTIANNGTIVIDNNLWVDAQIIGADTMRHRQSDFSEDLEVLPNTGGKYRMAWIFSAPDSSLQQNFYIQNNYWYVTPEIQAEYDSIKARGWDPAQQGVNTPQLSLYMEHLNKAADTSKAFIWEPITFKNVTKPWVDFLDYFEKPVSLGGGYDANHAYYGFDGMQYGPKMRWLKYFTDTLNLSYSTSSAAYTGGTDGFPAGDLNWFPSKKQEWLGTQTGIKKISSNAPTNYKLEQNYPNPFNPSTVISFEIPKSSIVNLAVYNILGEKVAQVFHGELKSGKYSYSFKATNLASGIYFYRIKAGNFMQTKKMMLLK